MYKGLLPLTLGAAFWAALQGCSSTSGAGPDGGSASTTGTGTTGTPDTGQFCENYCARVHSCDNTKDEQTCTNDCANDGAALIPKLRADTLGAVNGCVNQKDCATVLNSNVTKTCVEEAAASVAPSATATQFCDAYSTAATKCSETIDKADCLNESKVYGDPTLTQAIACTTKACTDIKDCIEATLASKTVISVNGSGSGTGGSQAGAGGSSSAGAGGSGVAGSSVPGTGGAGGSAVPPATCPGFKPATTICGTCQQKNCCTQLTSCANSTDCTSLAACVTPCADADCINACFANYPNGGTTFNNILNCSSDSCSAECGLQ